MTTERRSVYLAGPEVFLPNAVEIGARKKEICAELGFVGMFPLDNECSGTGTALADAIFRENRKAMDRGDLIVANLMPFRGASADPGTVFELGYMYALGKPVFGYGFDGRTYKERVLQVLGGGRGLSVEDFGLADNLMIVCALRDRGTRLVEIEYDWRTAGDMPMFKECLALAAEGRVK